MLWFGRENLEYVCSCRDKYVLDVSCLRVIILPSDWSSQYLIGCLVWSCAISSGHSAVGSQIILGGGRSILLGSWASILSLWPLCTLGRVTRERVCNIYCILLVGFGWSFLLWIPPNGHWCDNNMDIFTLYPFWEIHPYTSPTIFLFSIF